MKKEVIVSIGSNANKEKNLMQAKSLMAELFGNSIRFTDEIETEPIGIVSGMFTNCLAFAHTEMSFMMLEKKLKDIERACGDTACKRSENIIEMDIDILKYGNGIYHEQDWDRPYIKKLINNNKL